MTEDRSERQAIITGLLAHTSPERQAAWQSFALQGLDWDCIIDALCRNRAESLFSRNLTLRSSDYVPQGALDRLRKHHARNLRRSLRLKAELLRVTGILGGEGIVPVPLKGPVLAEQLYGDVGLREMGDLDILVSETDFDNAERLLLQNGYTPHQPMSAAEYARVRRRGHHMLYSNRERRTLVELHWSLTEKDRGLIPSESVDAEAFAKVDFGGAQLSVLRPEWLLVYLIVHGYRHQWGRLLWLVDVNQLVLTSELDWDEVCSIAARLNLWNVVSLGLTLATRTLDCKLPEQVHERLQRGASVDRWTERIDEQFFADDAEAGRFSTGYRYFAYCDTFLTSWYHRALHAALALRLLANKFVRFGGRSATAGPR